MEHKEIEHILVHSCALKYQIKVKVIRGDKHASLQFTVQELYSQHFNFFTTYEWGLISHSVILYQTEKFTRDKHSSLLGPFAS